MGLVPTEWPHPRTWREGGGAPQGSLAAGEPPLLPRFQPWYSFLLKAFRKKEVHLGPYVYPTPGNSLEWRRNPRGICLLCKIEEAKPCQLESARVTGNSLSGDRSSVVNTDVMTLGHLIKAAALRPATLILELHFSIRP